MQSIIEALRQFRGNNAISESEMANFMLVQFKLGAFDTPPEKTPRKGRRKKADLQSDAKLPEQEA